MERPCATRWSNGVALLLACRSGIEGQLFLMFPSSLFRWRLAAYT